jgi:hypothetical protein
MYPAFFQSVSCLERFRGSGGFGTFMKFMLTRMPTQKTAAEEIVERERERNEYQEKAATQEGGLESKRLQPNKFLF